MLRLDYEGLKRDLFFVYQNLVQEFVDKLAREANSSKPAPPERNIPAINITHKDAEIIGWHIAGEVTALGGWAVISEFGSGSQMELDNPALQWYMDSQYWNPLRPRSPGAPIMGRPRGRYIDIFGRQRYSAGSAAGRVIEGSKRFKPVKGTAWFRAIFKLNQRIFARRCLTVLQQFPIHKYVIDKRVR